jgi:hypothetical protein
MTDTSSTSGQPTDGQRLPRPMAAKNNPFKNGFRPNGKRTAQTQSYMNKKALLRYMLDVDITVTDLPIVIADHIRTQVPGFLENVERKFTMRQILEVVQIQLLFSRSDYVKQAAIIAIKDRIEGKPMQKIQVDNAEADPTEFILPNGRKIAI